MQKPIYATIFSLLLLPTLARAEPPLKLQIVELPPYMIVNSPTSIGGLVVDPTFAALKKAGIDFEWEVIPAVRQLLRIKNNQERICSVGWYKTPTRELFAKFSRPIVADSGYAAFANNNYKPREGIPIDEVLNDSKITVLIKNGFVYGEYLDAKFIDMKARSEAVYVDMPLIFKMIEAGRGQITFAPLAEIRYYQELGVVDKDRFHVIAFKEIPTGFNRYLMCSLKVEDELINKFNAALGK
jgi:polar amino acid transport system substrate-binding protein